MSQQCKKSNSSKMEQIAKIFMNNQSLKKHEVNIKKKRNRKSNRRNSKK